MASAGYSPDYKKLDIIIAIVVFLIVVIIGIIVGYYLSRGV